MSSSQRTPHADRHTDGDDRAAHVPPTSAPSPREHSAQLMAKSMSDMTVSEIRAALLSMPAVVRESLMDTPQSALQPTARPTRRGSYDDSPAYTPGANLSHNISSSMHDEYFGSHRRNSEQYDRFMGESYPAVGEFYPNQTQRRRATEDYEDVEPAESSAEEDEDEGEESRSDRELEHFDRRVPTDQYEYAAAEEEYVPRYEPEATAEDSDFPQEYGNRVFDGEAHYREERNGNFKEVQRNAKVPQKTQTNRQQKVPSRSLPSSTDHRYGEGRSQTKTKAKLPEAAKQSSSPSYRSNQRDRDATSDRESLIPRRVDTSPRLGSTLRKIDTGRDQSDGYDSSVSPAVRARNSMRAASAQRMPSNRVNSSTKVQKPDGHPAEQSHGAARSVSTGSVGDRSRYLPEAERKQALEWSRKQAWEKKVRSNFSGSPLRAASPATATPAALKLKYRSFNNSVEKEDFNSSLEANGVTQQQQLGGKRVQQGAPRAESSRPVSALEKHSAVQEAMGAIARSRARAHLDEQVKNKSQNKSDHITYSANAFSKKPESFFAFRNHRAVGNSQGNQDSFPDQEGTAARKSSPSAVKARPALVDDSPPVAAESFIRSNQQMLAGYQVRRSPERTTNQENTMTNVAEWRRLTEWLSRIGMQRYIEVLRVNGVTKLSLVELMLPEDMGQIGIAPADIDVIHSKVTEFTNRTRSFSEQVLNRAAGSLSPSPPTSHTGSTSHHIVPAVPVSAPVVAPASHGSSVQRIPTHQNNSHPVRRPDMPPPHLLVKNAKVLTPFARKNQSNAAIPLPVTPADFDPEDSQPEEVLESVRIATEEHIFSDVRQIRAELLRCFEVGERELFFHAWKQVTLYMPDDCNTLNPHRPSMYNAKQVIEFHLHLHFAVFPITHAQGRKAEKQGKLALRRYLECVMLTSELDSLNQLDGITSRSSSLPEHPSEKVSSSPRGDESGLLLDTNLLNVTSNSIASPTTPFTRTREYAVYAGMVLVPDPQENVAFHTLFQPQWMQSLKERLGQFLSLVSPNVEIVNTMSTAASSVVGAINGPIAVDEPVLVDDSFEEVADQTPLSIPSKVRNYLEPALASTPAPSQGRLDDFEIAFTSPINGKYADPSSPSHAEMQVEEIDLSSPVADLRISTKLIEEVVSPLEMSPSEADVPRKKMIPTKLSDEGAMSKLTRIASPVSAVSSVISQLTDDDYPRSGTAVAALKFEDSRYKDSLPHKTAASTTTGKAATSERKPKLKPFSSTSKSAMQSQVDVYNKLMKQGAGPKLDSVEENQLHSADLGHESTALSSDPVTSPHATFRTTRRATTNNSNPPKTASLNVGFGLKRRSTGDLPDQSLAAQVARYNKLLTSTPAAVSAEDLPLPSGASEDTAEGISAAEAQRVEEVLLEMQHIYNSSAEVFDLHSPNNDDVQGSNKVPDQIHELSVVEQKIELHEQSVPSVLEVEEQQINEVAE